MAIFKLNYSERPKYIDISNSLNSECNDSYRLLVKSITSPVFVEITSFGPAGFNTGMVSESISSDTIYDINLAGFISKNSLLNSINSHIVIKVKELPDSPEALDTMTLSRTHSDSSC